jgi:predicted nucleic-acid-binding protein
MKRALIDANVILRYVTKDPEPLARAAEKLFLDAQGGKVSLLIIPLVVAEVVWVLESFYNFPKSQIAQTMTEFLVCDGLEVESLDLLMETFAFYGETNIDFADARLGITALHKGVPFVYSFDRHLNRIAGVTRLQPGQEKTAPSH